MVRCICLGICLSLASLMFNCSQRIHKVAYPTLSDGRYDTEFPYRDSAKELREIGNTVKRINSIAFYKSYVFSPGRVVSVNELKGSSSVEQLADNVIYFSNTAAGTATIILSTLNQVGLLTCAHVVDFPDTVVTYYKSADRQRNLSVKSIAIKDRQENYITDLAEVGDVEIILLDPKLDVAILGQQWVSINASLVPAFNYAIGKARELEWGSFVYLFGFPRGYKMITKAIVSSPNRDTEGTFLVDALFNRGFSGGIVIAVRDGVPNFELVGIAKSAAAEYEYTIVPPQNFDSEEYNPHVVYTGELFVENRASIQYGVTHVIPIDAIVRFIRENESRLLNKGYNFRNLYR